MSAINQNSDNVINNNDIVYYDNYKCMVVNKEVINNNTFITNECVKGKALLRDLLNATLEGEMSFVVIDDELCVMSNIFKKTLYRPNDNVSVHWLDVEDLVDDCDIMVRGVDVQEYVQDNDAQFSMTVIVGDDVDFSSNIMYENRMGGRFGNVETKFGPDVFSMVLPYKVVNEIMDRYSYEIGYLRPYNRTMAHHDFECDGLQLRVVGIHKHGNGSVWFAITDVVHGGEYSIRGEYLIVEDKFGNRLDQDGEIIPEDDE